MTGIARVAGSAFRCAVASSPSMSGSWISIRISAGSASRANIRPASASLAVSTVYPADSSTYVASLMLVGLSSTMRIVAMSARRVPARKRASHLRAETRPIELPLLHDRRDRSAESLVIGLGDPCRGHHDDRDASRLDTLSQRLHDVEPVHRRHHQVEH